MILLLVIGGIDLANALGQVFLDPAQVYYMFAKLRFKFQEQRLI